MTVELIGKWECPECGGISYNVLPLTDVLKFPVIKCKVCKKMCYDQADADKEDKNWAREANKRKEKPAPLGQ